MSEDSLKGLDPNRLKSDIKSGDMRLTDEDFEVFAELKIPPGELKGHEDRERYIEFLKKRSK